jgi:uncharacterized damage-inducible protein DinB
MSAMRAEQARLLASYNTWMNDKLYGVCATLSDEDRKRDRGAFFKSIHGTLNHLLLADSVWMGRFESKPFAIRSLDQELYAGFDELHAQRREMDARIERWANGLTEAALGETLTYTSGITKQTYAPTVWKVALHFFNHQTHHRGQVTTLLHQAGVDYGVTDLLFLPGVLGR